MHKDFPIQKCVLIFFIVVFAIPQYCLSQDTTQIKKQRNHLSFNSNIGLRYVDQEIPIAIAGGIGVSYQIKNHFFTFRTLTRIATINRADNFMLVNPWFAPDETIREFGLLYRVYSNEKKTLTLDAGLSYINGFNHGNIIMQPDKNNVMYNKEKFNDVGIPIEVRYLLGGNDIAQTYICSIANLNFVKTFASIVFMFQLKIPNHEK